MPQVDSVLGLANVDAMDGYVLTDRLTPRQFAELTDLDIEVARLLYSAYAVDQEDYGQVVSGLDSYGVPLIDMFLYVYDMMDEGYISLDADMTETIEDLHVQLTDAQLQLKGENYSRLVLQLNLPEEGRRPSLFWTLCMKLWAVTTRKIPSWWATPPAILIPRRSAVRPPSPPPSPLWSITAVRSTFWTPLAALTSPAR